MRRAVGLDFGTTNSAIGVADEGGQVALARYAHGGGSSETFRSVLYFHPDDRRRDGRVVPTAGRAAIDRYLGAEVSGRLIQSIKSYVASKQFSSTSVFGQTFTLEALMGEFLSALREESEKSLGPLGTHVVVGRPVRFADGDSDEAVALALTRLRAAVRSAGFEDIAFEYEPVAAAYHYESRLDHDEIVLIADFGGGTSDFSLVRVGPSHRHGEGRRVIGTEGVAVAGDAFDGRIMQHAVSPGLGVSSSYRSIHGKLLPMPVWIYQHLRRWHRLSFLKSRETLELLRKIRETSLAPAQIEALLSVVEDDLGYHLFRSVEGLKTRLSAEPSAELSFHEPPVEFDERVARAEFEEWIADELAQMVTAVERLLGSTGVSRADVDRVFLTGGSSLVPRVREIFSSRFGEARLRGGEELTSVVSGLALRAREI